MSGTLSLSDEEIEEIREIFSHFDSDGNGTIEREELGALMRTLDDTSGEEDVRLALEVLDENHNGVIDFDEFLEWWAEH